MPDRALPPALRALLRLAVVVGVVLALHRIFQWGTAEAQLVGHGAMLPLWIMGALLCIYALMLALPFVPGVELGLALLMAEGAWMAPIVYLATIAGLMLAFAAGALLPYPLLRRMVGRLGLKRSATALDRIAPLDRAERLQLLEQSLPRWVPAWVLRYRYVMLAVLINLPGNMVLGGGGGILLFAGLSRLFGPLATVLTLMVAVAPVPLLVGLSGWGLR